MAVKFQCMADFSDLQLRRAYRRYFQKTSFPILIPEIKTLLVEAMGTKSARKWVEDTPGTSETREPL